MLVSSDEGLRFEEIRGGEAFGEPSENFRTSDPG